MSNVYNLEFKAIENQPRWLDNIMEIAERDGVIYHRKKGNYIIYIHEKERYSCMECGVTISTVEREHHVSYGLPILNINAEIEQIPYCPNCEEKPNDSGKFIILKRD